MKKLLLTLSLLLGLILSVNAETYTYTFTEKVFTANGTQTLGDFDWTLAGSGGYWGYDSTKGQQFGSGSLPYKSMTFSTSGVPGTITSITINTSGASSINANLNVSVGGTQFGDQVKLTTSATNYTFEGNGEGEVVLSYTQTSSKAIYIKSISITYTEGEVKPTLEAPTFSHENGFEFTSPFELTITAEDGATIYYTLDGNDPTTESNVYSAPIEISETTTVKAYAVADGFNDSPIATATYNYVDPNAVTKSICIKASGVAEPAGYSFPNEVLVNDSGYDFGGFNVKFSGTGTNDTQDYIDDVRFYGGEILTITPPEGRTIKRVELNVVGKTGTITSTIGTCSGDGGKNQIWEGRTTEALELTATAQIRFSYMTITYEESSDAIQTLATPTFSHEDGFEFTSPFELTISAEDGATIYYSIDGTDPSLVYENPITISETTTVKAYAVADGFNDSPIATATYTYVDPNSIKKYGLVTSADQLVVDGNYLIAYNAVAMGAQSGNYFSKVDINEASNGIISISTEAVNPVTLGGEAGAWTFKTALEDKYLYLDVAQNYLKTYAELIEGANNGVKWTISIEADNTAKIGSNSSNANTNGDRYLQYNGSYTRFACYTGTQNDPYLYAEMKYIYICDETVAGDVEIISIVDSESAAVTYSALETGEWALTRAENTYNKRYAYVPSNGTYTITYQYTKNDEVTTDVREFAADQEVAFITFSDDTITGIDGINADNNAPVEYFNMQGIRVANPENGLFIRRQGNKVEKIIL